jgi:protein-disulfide isomerase
VAALKTAGSAVSLETGAFNQCLDSSRYRSRIGQSLQEGRALRLLGTPTFMINGRSIPGVPTFDYLVRVIDPLLANR